MNKATNDNGWLPILIRREDPARERQTYVYDPYLAYGCKRDKRGGDGLTIIPSSIQRPCA